MRRAGSEPTTVSVSAKALTAPLAMRGKYFFLSSSEPKSLSGCGTPIDWWADRRAVRFASTLPRSCITFAYSTWLRPRPPYSTGTFMPNAPKRFNASTTAGGYSPVRSISAGSTSSRRKRSSSE